MRSYIDGMLRYFEVSGRSTRMQYWMFFLVEFILICVAIGVDYQLGGFVDTENPQAPFTLFALFVHIVPSFTVQIRRLHDIGKSGAWYLINFVPLGSLVLMYWACCAAEDGSNAYDGVAPSTYEPRYKPQSVAPRRSTIPRDIRMGSGRTPSVSARRDEPAVGRFI